MITLELIGIEFRFGMAILLRLSAIDSFVHPRLHLVFAALGNVRFASPLAAVLLLADTALRGDFLTRSGQVATSVGPPLCHFAIA